MAKKEYVIAIHYQRDSEGDKDKIVEQLDKTIKEHNHNLIAEQVYEAYFFLECSARFQHSQNEISEFDLAEFTAVYEYDYLYKYYAKYFKFSKEIVDKLVLILLESGYAELGTKGD